jgi:hypothetical protein
MEVGGRRSKEEEDEVEEEEERRGRKMRGKKRKKANNTIRRESLKVGIQQNMRLNETRTPNQPPCASDPSHSSDPVMHPIFMIHCIVNSSVIVGCQSSSSSRASSSISIGQSPRRPSPIHPPMSLKGSLLELLHPELAPLYTLPGRALPLPLLLPLVARTESVGLTMVASGSQFPWGASHEAWQERSCGGRVSRNLRMPCET